MTSSTLGSAVCAIVVLAGVLLVALIEIASLRSKLAYRERTIDRLFTFVDRHTSIDDPFARGLFESLKCVWDALK